MRGGGQPFKLIVLLAIFTLSFFSLTAITFPIQQTNAYTAPLCGPASGTGAEPVTATTVTYGGKKFDIIGYNKNGNEVGVAGPNNSVTLLLDKDEVYTLGFWNENPINTYKDSTISKLMGDFVNFSLSTTADIIARTLTGGSGNYNAGGYNEDLIAGPDVTNQKVWPLSVDEAEHLILSGRVFPHYWWLRSPGEDDYSAARVISQNRVYPNGGYVDIDGADNAIRPALYLSINSPALSSVIASGAWQSNSIPIGACAPQPNNIGINYIAETITGLDNDTQGWSLSDSYVGLTTLTQTTVTPINISSNIGATASTLYYVKATTNTDLYFNSNSDSNGVAKSNAVEGFSKLTIPARPSAPSGLNGVAPSDVGASDGKITGTSNKLEYSTDEVSWTSVTGAAITGLTSGTYFVRTIADQSASKFKSFATEVIVKAGSSKPASGKQGPSVGDGGFSGEGTAQTGVDFAGLGLLLAMMLIGAVVLRGPKVTRQSCPARHCEA